MKHRTIYSAVQDSFQINLDNTEWSIRLVSGGGYEDLSGDFQADIIPIINELMYYFNKNYGKRHVMDSSGTYRFPQGLGPGDTSAPLMEIRSTYQDFCRVFDVSCDFESLHKAVRRVNNALNETFNFWCEPDDTYSLEVYLSGIELSF